MPDYKYRGMLRNGKILRGIMTARNRHDVIVKLKKTRVQPIVVKSVKTQVVSESKKKIDQKKLAKIQQDVERQKSYSKMRRPRINDKTGIMGILTSDVSFGGVKPKDVLTFTNSLYVLKKAKFNNVAAFESLFNSTENKKLQDIVEDILIGVESGATINEMMARYPKVFPPLYVNFVRVGEESGSLDAALLHARDYMESSMKLKKQIRGILLPKVLMFVFILVAMIIALLFGAPLIQNVYDMFGVDKELPAATQVAISMAKWVVEYWYVVLAVVAGIFVLFRTYLATSIGRYQWDKFKIKAPVFGTLNLNIITNKFFQAMLLNLKNGMRIQESLETSKSVTDNYYFLSLIETAKNNLQAGGSWIEPFEGDKAFPPMAVEMLKIGMESDLVEMMDKVSEYIEQEIAESIQKTIKVLPEITYVFVGIVLVFFVITVMVPLIDVYMGGFLLETI
ncbi:MAG: type II secretion system F family protein [Clostridia bacterium]|nr:type II secretion system F family protein [Clostridia bacterium]